MNSGIVDSTFTCSPVPTPNIRTSAPSKSASKPRAPNSAPSAVPPSMIVNSGAPHTNTIARRKVSSLAMSVRRSHPLGRGLAPDDVVDVDDRVEDRVQDDQGAADRDQEGDAAGREQQVVVLL